MPAHEACTGLHRLGLCRFSVGRSVVHARLFGRECRGCAARSDHRCDDDRRHHAGDRLFAKRRDRRCAWWPHFLQEQQSTGHCGRPERDRVGRNGRPLLRAASIRSDDRNAFRHRLERTERGHPVDQSEHRRDDHRVEHHVGNSSGAGVDQSGHRRQNDRALDRRSERHVEPIAFDPQAHRIFFESGTQQTLVRVDLSPPGSSSVLLPSCCAPLFFVLDAGAIPLFGKPLLLLLLAAMAWVGVQRLASG
jgi:hypothetical protein